MKQFFIFARASMIIGMIAGCISLTSTSAVLAQSLPPPTIGGKAWLLLDMTSGQVIAAQEPDLKVEPASLTKIMTAYLTFAALRDKKLALKQTVTVSLNAWRVDPSSSKMFIDPKVPVSIEDLLYGLMVQSGNDAAIALAEAVAGDEAAFVALMNREAARMGLTATRFANPHGLPHRDNYTTARDLSVLASRVIADFPEFYKIDSVKSFTYNKISQPNRNLLLWRDPTVDGMKTGYTDGAGYCMITSAKRPGASGDRRLISILMGANSLESRAQESQKLLNWGFQNFDAVKLYSKGQVLESTALWKGTQNQIKIGFNKDVIVTLPKGAAEKVKPTLERKDPLVAPLAANTKVGTVKVTLDGKAFLELPVVALEAVPQAGILGRAWDSMRLWMK